MAGVLADTHILLWWRTEPRKLSKPQRQILELLEDRKEALSISAITLWELAKMHERKKLIISRSLDLWLGELEQHLLVDVVPLSARIVAESVQLGNSFHRDPADQIIVATARCLGRKLITSDKRIRDWGGIECV